MNYVLGQEKGEPSNPVYISPYLASISAQGITLGYTAPFFHSAEAYPNIISAIYYPFEQQLTLGAIEPLPVYGIAAHKRQQIILEWRGSQKNRMSAPVLQGSPYLTVFFQGIIPQLSSSFKYLRINKQFTPGLIEKSNRYEIELSLDNDKTQTWLLYSEKPIQLLWTSDYNGNQLKATQSYQGWIRLVLLKDSATALYNDSQLLDQYSKTIPLSYEMTYDVQDKHIIYTLKWQTQNNQPPLLLSLPHQRTNYYPLQAPRVIYSGMNGLMVAETSSSWMIELPRPPLEFLEPKKLDKQQVQILQQALQVDTNYLFTQDFPDDGSYRTGKRLLRTARLILLADRLGENKIKGELIHFLERYLNRKMYGQSEWIFEYDSTWGGIIPNLSEYGMRRYNDHHYHYGYWVYTFAILARFDPSWLTSAAEGQSYTPKDWIETLIRDYANPNENDPFFIGQRQQDDYVGHSWASGLENDVDGQNQQSTSEAVNAYNAIALYAQATHNPELTSWGEFLTAREIQSAQVYWQVKKDSPVYDSKFRKNNLVIGFLWASKVDANAFFYDCKTEYRCGLEYSFGIQMLPFTAISATLLDKQWLKQSHKTLIRLISGYYGPIPSTWRWFLIKGLAGVMSAQERADYFKQAVKSKPDEYDLGDSKSNTLYFLIK